MAQETGPAIFGEEKLDADAMSIVDRTIVPDERILALSGFDHESKIIAVTDQQILITHKEQGITFQSPYSGIKEVGRNGRTLVIRTSDDARHEYRMRKDDTVESLVNAIRELMPDCVYQGFYCIIFPHPVFEAGVIAGSDDQGSPVAPDLFDAAVGRLEYYSLFFVGYQNLPVGDGDNL